MYQAGLYEPSLDEKNGKPTKSYYFRSIFYLAFFAGAIAMVIPVLINAYWLRLKKEVYIQILQYTLLVFGLKFLLVFAETMAWYAPFAKSYHFVTRLITLLGCYLIYQTMRKAYKRHLYFHKDTKMLWPLGLVLLIPSVWIEITFHDWILAWLKAW